MRWINFKLHNPRNILFTAIFIALLLFILIIGEILYNIARPTPFILDAELGWMLKSNFSRNFIQKNLDGSEYQANYTTNEMGLRTHGSSESAAIKILVLGDSFTGDPYAGNSDMWYAVAAEKLQQHGYFGKKKVHVWAGGAGGYGSYQELLLLKRLLKNIKPDLFILQFCSNDFTNNHQNWEDTQIVRSQKFRRPYLGPDLQSNFSIDSISFLWRLPVIGDSRLFTFIDWLVLMAQYNYYKGYGPKLDSALMKSYESESVSITSFLFNEMQKELNGIPAFMTNCSSNNDGPNKHWKKLATKAGFIPVSDPSDSIIQNKQSGVILHHLDGGHLNIKGNQMYGEALAHALLKLPHVSPIQGRSGQAGR